jgi:cobalamin biosynthesis protein CobW
MRRVPATVITGFLGAGKTSLVRHLLARANGRHLPVIVNEFGELGIDRELLVGCGDAACTENDIVEPADGCLCCTVAGDFPPTLTRLLDRADAPDHILRAVGGRLQQHFDRPWHQGEERQTRLVVIGRKGLDRAAITAALGG